ncbi:class I SAM-dependent methyltransferase [Brevundimonas faecalis]|uniref:class I SAM-dependent methyltransferase n=1 Tax=Brevundimonas faecalis TaxID=947378 RepID=UPI00360680A3
MIIDRTATHELLARPLHDEAARTQYIVQLKNRLRRFEEGNRIALEARAAPTYAAARGEKPETVEQITEAMVGDPFYQIWSAFSRSAQDVMWNSVGETIQRELPRMKAVAARLDNAPAGGSCETSPDFAAPADAYAGHIHGQPGGYMRGEESTEDFVAGALYESGGNAYSLGVGIGTKDSKSAAVIDFLAERYPDFKPRRILDLACSSGGATVGYAASFPEAEVYGVDVAPGLLRYAHLRAEAMGLKAHFRQMDAGDMPFEDESFDLVVSHNMMHEVSRESLGRIFREARRVLRPGGIVVHQDVPMKGADFSPFEKFIFAWQTKNNDEPFWDEFLATHAPSVMQEVGFASDQILETTVRMRDGPRAWYVVLGEKPAV